MLKLMSSRWVQLGAATFVAGAVVGVVVAFVALSGDSSVASVGDRLALSSGGTIEEVEGRTASALTTEEVQHLPLTADKAVAAGWKDPVLCSPGRGRYFQKGTPEEGEPFFLLYNDQDELFGIYQFSLTKMPAPWKRYDELRGGGSLLLLEEHWSLIVLFKDWIRACTSEAQRTEAGRGEDWIVTASRSTPTPYVPPTPTPAPADVLEAAAKRMSSLSSFSFTLTAEPEGTPLMPDIQARSIQGSVQLPNQVTVQATDAAGATSEVSADSLPFDFTDLGVKIGAIARAIQGPEDTARQWIDNVPSRGAAGTVSGEDLVALVPLVAAKAQLTVQMWFDTEGLVRRVRIEGPLAPDDPPGVVRVLEMRDFE